MIHSRLRRPVIGILVVVAIALTAAATQVIAAGPPAAFATATSASPWLRPAILGVPLHTLRQTSCPALTSKAARLYVQCQIRRERPRVTALWRQIPSV